MQETRVRFMGWEGPLEKEMATHSSILACRIPWTEEPAGYSPWGHKESDTTEHTHIYTAFEVVYTSVVQQKYTVNHLKVFNLFFN